MPGGDEPFQEKSLWAIHTAIRPFWNPAAAGWQNRSFPVRLQEAHFALPLRSAAVMGPPPKGKKAWRKNLDDSEVRCAAITSTLNTYVSSRREWRPATASHAGCCEGFSLLGLQSACCLTSLRPLPCAGRLWSLCSSRRIRSVVDQQLRP
jgi:hypothetical protein